MTVEGIPDDLVRQIEAEAIRVYFDHSTIRELFDAAGHVKVGPRVTADTVLEHVHIKSRDLDALGAAQIVDLVTLPLASGLVRRERDCVLDPQLPRTSLQRASDLGIVIEESLRLVIAEGGRHPVMWVPPELLVHVPLDMTSGAVSGPADRPYGHWGTYRGFPVIAQMAAPLHAVWVFDAGGAYLRYGPDPRRPVSITARSDETGVVISARLPIAVEYRAARRFLRIELVDSRPVPDA